MQPDRRAKVQALLDSPNEGERLAARAALDRIEEALPPAPKTGTAEWQTAKQEWLRKIQFCTARLGSPILSPLEVRTIRNMSRNIGDPWSLGAKEFMAIYRRLSNAEQDEKSL